MVDLPTADKEQSAAFIVSIFVHLALRSTKPIGNVYGARQYFATAREVLIARPRVGVVGARLLVVLRSVAIGPDLIR